MHGIPGQGERHGFEGSIHALAIIAARLHVRALGPQLHGFPVSALVVMLVAHELARVARTEGKAR
jgi:hypothetical protein